MVQTPSSITEWLYHDVFIILPLLKHMVKNYSKLNKSIFCSYLECMSVFSPWTATHQLTLLPPLASRGQQNLFIAAKQSFQLEAGSWKQSTASSSCGLLYLSWPAKSLSTQPHQQVLSNEKSEIICGKLSIGETRRMFSIVFICELWPFLHTIVHVWFKYCAFQPHSSSYWNNTH